MGTLGTKVGGCPWLLQGRLSVGGIMTMSCNAGAGGGIPDGGGYVVGGRKCTRYEGTYDPGAYDRVGGPGGGMYDLGAYDRGYDWGGGAFANRLGD
jgi:hypothetical protein